MRIKWRFGVIAIQCVIAIVANYFIVGDFLVNETWFYAGLLAVIVNPQLLEPWYTRPVDVIVNTLIFWGFYASATVTETEIVWVSIGIYLGISSAFAIIATIGGANKNQGQRWMFAQPARILSKYASARFIYFSILLLSAFEIYNDSLDIFFRLLAVWLFIIFLGYLNWQRIWESFETDTYLCDVEGMVGPALINVSTNRLPAQGSSVLIQLKNDFVKGVIIKRIRRLADLWAQILIFDHNLSEKIISGDVIRIIEAESESINVVGTVEQGSTESRLKFISTKPLELGEVIGVKIQREKFVLYQISHVEVKEITTRGGAHFTALVTAVQLGIFNNDEKKLIKHRWIPSLGGAVIQDPDIQITESIDQDSSNYLLGNVVETNIPIYMDLDRVSEGHLAVLGMTKMGKSTLAEKLIKQLQNTRNVAILDQTGEYVSKKGFSECNSNTDYDNPGSYVIEPKPSVVPADKALSFFKFFMDKGVQEYKSGTPKPRTIVVEEAHQFIPEPAGLGFNTPGRDSSIQTGVLMMQIRKYNLATIIISQRTAVIAKSALSQCENFVVFRSVDQTGLDYIQNVAGFDFSDLVAQLNQGEALVFGPAISSDNPVVVNIHQ